MQSASAEGAAWRSPLQTPKDQGSPYLYQTWEYKNTSTHQGNGSFQGTHRLPCLGWPGIGWTWAWRGKPRRQGLGKWYWQHQGPLALWPQISLMSPLFPSISVWVLVCQPLGIWRNEAISAYYLIHKKWATSRYSINNELLPVQDPWSVFIHFPLLILSTG